MLIHPICRFRTLPDGLTATNHPSSMKKIEAIIKPFKLEDLKEALHEIGI